MENQIAINIKYFAFGNGNDGFHEIDSINDFKDQIHEEYISSFHIHEAECGGGHFIIEFIYNLSLSDFLSFIVGGVAWDLIKYGTKKYAIDTFVKLYKKFRKDEVINDIRDVTFLFNDTKIEFYSILDREVEVDFELIGELFITLANNYERLTNEKGKNPTEICVPVFLDSISGKEPVFRAKLEVDEPFYFEGNKRFERIDYWGYWGVKYSDYDRAVYNVSENVLSEINWFTEQEFLR